MFDNNHRVSHPVQKTIILRSRLGRSTLEKILIPGVIILFIGCVVLGVLIFKNFNPSGPGATTASSSQSSSTSEKITQTETTAKETSKASDTTAPPTISQTESSVPLTSATTTAESSTKPSISNPDTMYSSYANLVSFDPKTGWAEFDYFDMLRGADAVKYLVDVKGYTQAAAEAYVAGFADSEFINKNVNPQLRTADMSVITIKMLYKPNGAQAASFPDDELMTYNDFKTLYASHSDKVLTTGGYFYYVTVSGGQISKVVQVYWP